MKQKKGFIISVYIRFFVSLGIIKNLNINKMNTQKQAPKAEVITKSLKISQPSEPTAEEKKTTFDALVEKFTEKPKPTAEERINRIEHFEAVSRRFKKLKEKANDLKMFDAGNDKTNAKIILKNSEGFEFSVSNSNVIKKVRDAMQNELNILLSEAENEILTFEI